MTEGYLTTRQAAEKIGSEPTYIAALALRGDLPGSYKEGKSWLISRSALEVYAKKRKEREPPDLDPKELYRYWLLTGDQKKVAARYGTSPSRASQVMKDAGYDVGKSASNRWRVARKASYGGECPHPCPWNTGDKGDCLDVGCHIPEWWEEGMASLSKT